MFIVSNAKLPSPGPIIYSFIMLSFLPIWIGREKVKATMPLKFQRCCQNVTVMLDCLVIAQETSSSLTLKSQTFSNCKIRMTLKGLMGVSPSGLEFISPLYTVCISDKEMTSISGVLPWLEPTKTWQTKDSLFKTSLLMLELNFSFHFLNVQGISASFTHLQ